MSDLPPAETTNIATDGSQTIPWSRAHAALVAAQPDPEILWIIGTLRPDGRPHAAGIGASWFDGDVFITSNPNARRARNLAGNSNATLSVRLPGIDLTLEGTVVRKTDPRTLEEVAALNRAAGWPAEVDGDAFTAPWNAPSAGSPPWYVYRFTCQTVFGVATEEPWGATRWRFAR